MNTGCEYAETCATVQIANYTYHDTGDGDEVRCAFVTEVCSSAYAAWRSYDTRFVMSRRYIRHYTSHLTHVLDHNKVCGRLIRTVCRPAS